MRASTLTAFRGVVLAAFAALAAAAALPAAAQAWPTKPVKFVVPFPPGGSVDPLARLLGVRLSESLGQQFIVENKPGASGSIGTAFVAKSPPDGYTFVVVFDTHAVNPALIPNMGFDTTKDLAPVMLVGTAPMALGKSQSAQKGPEVIEPQRLSDAPRARRAKPRLSQAAVAARLGFSQSRVAKMVAGDVSVSLDLLVRALARLGATKADVAKAMQTPKRPAAA